MKRPIALLLVLAIAVASCGTGDSDNTSSPDAASELPTSSDPTETVEASEDFAAEGASSKETSAESALGDESENGEAEDGDSSVAGETSSFVIEVWADNWSAVYIDGDLVGEDSVPITTERSFNAETYTFEAAYPFTVAIEAKDFKETDSGIEYIGQGKQQMGDGGIIVQITDMSSGVVVASTNGSWAALVVHRAPLNKECEKDADPDATCEFEITETPGSWTAVDFDDTGWSAATEWSEGDVGPKDGYNEISWDSDAHLIWGSDLETDNTVLLRTIVTG